MRKVFLLVLLSIPSWAMDPCTTSSAVATLIPGAHWNMVNNDLSTLEFVDVSTFTVPSKSEVNAQIAACQDNQSKIATYTLELSTTSASLIGQTTGYLSISAIGKDSINKRMARIAELRSLLGLQ